MIAVLKALQERSAAPRPVDTVVAISAELTAAEAPQTPQTPAAAGNIPAVEDALSSATPAASLTASAPASPPVAETGHAPSPAHAPAGSLMEVDAAMNFTNFASWIEMQKRLSSVVPPVKVDIRRISKDGAAFTMKFRGTVDILRKMLEEQGIALSPPPAGTDPSAPYDLRLVERQ
jgi:hypothetical protein